MPIVATVGFDVLDMTVLLRLVAPSQHHTLEEREHGRTIPLADFECVSQQATGRRTPSPESEDQACSQWVTSFSRKRRPAVKLMDSLPGEAIAPVPELANRTPFAFVVDSLLVRATDYSVGHRD
jgi:hypothetical protein